MKFNVEKILSALGGKEVVAKMDSEERAEALEVLRVQELAECILHQKTVSQIDEEISTRTFRKGVGTLYCVGATTPFGVRQANEDLFVQRLPKMPQKPGLIDYFKLRFFPAHHLLRSADLALKAGMDEEIVFACLLHDLGQVIMKTDHGWWGAQLLEPYVSEKVSFAIRYHQALRFFPDDSVNYEYPKDYNAIFGCDYEPPPYIMDAYQYCRNHKWYMAARLITVNDDYAFNPYHDVEIDKFTDIIGRNFNHPKEGLGFDNTSVAHMWRS
ncbi:MAG: HD domain-containing protein, partial [Methylocystis sp.]